MTHKHLHNDEHLVKGQDEIQKDLLAGVKSPLKTLASRPDYAKFFLNKEFNLTGGNTFGYNLVEVFSDGCYAYFPCRNGSAILKLKIEDMSQINLKTYSTLTGEFYAITGDDEYLYVVNTFSGDSVNSLIKVDKNTLEVVSSELLDSNDGDPWALSSDEDSVYVTYDTSATGESRVTRHLKTTLVEVGIFSADSADIWSFNIVPRGDYIYYAATPTTIIYKIDKNTMTIVGTKFTDPDSESISAPLVFDGTYFYYSTSNKHIRKVDPETMTVLGTYDLSSNIYTEVVSDYLYVGRFSGSDSIIEKINTENMTKEEEFTLTGFRIASYSKFLLVNDFLVIPEYISTKVIRKFVGSHSVPSEASARTTTKIVAANDSSIAGKIGADYVCDGVDDQVEINQALVDINTLGGGKLSLLEGQYNISGYITSYISDLTVEGQGKSTIINATVSIDYAFNDLGARSIIRNLRILGANITSADILLNYCPGDIILENLWIDDGQIGIYKGTSYGTLRNAVIRNNIVSNMTGDYGAGIWIHEGENNVIKGNHLFSNKIGIRVKNSVKNIVINNIIKDSTNEAILLEGGAVVATGQDLVVIGNIIDTAEYGIYLSDSHHCITQGNFIKNCQKDGVRVYRGDYNIIKGNSLLNNGQTGTPQIDLDDVVVKNIITDNEIISKDGNASYGIRETTNCDYNIIANNVVEGHGTSQIVTVGANTIKANNIELP